MSVKAGLDDIAEVSSLMCGRPFHIHFDVLNIHFASIRALSGVLSTHKSLPGAVTAIFEVIRCDFGSFSFFYIGTAMCGAGGGLHMKNATIEFLLPDASPISKAGFYN